MARPRKGAEGSEAATAKWRKTMKARYGGKKGVHEMMQMIGSKGGQAPTDKPKGFAANRERARMAGAKGGRISKRTGVSTGQRKEKEYMWRGGQNEKLVFKKEEE